jgi:iron complex outermembrane recepter protein
MTIFNKVSNSGYASHGKRRGKCAPLRSAVFAPGIVAGLLCMPGAHTVSAQDAPKQDGAAPGTTPLPEINVTEKKRAAKRAAAKPSPGPTAQSTPASGSPQAAPATSAPLAQTPQLGKTGTKLEDLPASVQIVPREVAAEQGSTMLRQAINNASGITEGGQDSLGYFDHFLIRGLNAQIYNDGFSDGDQLGGLSHSLNGVKQFEILEGPGSALLGSGPPGGTINIVHYEPSPDFHWGESLQAGSFGTVTNNFYVTGPTTVQGLNYRVDGTISRSDGFRDLASQDYELRPDFTWQAGDHLFEFTLDVRHLNQTPDSYGLIYFHGSPIESVPIEAKYSTPFAFAKQDYVRPTFSDKWEVSSFLTINNRFSYLYRSLDVLRNGDSTSTQISTSGATAGEVIGRQLREQHDTDNNFDYQLEPIWKFATSAALHTLLTGFEYQHQSMATNRSTADLPNITNAFAPTPPETSVNGLNFLCDSKHSCDNDQLVANYYSLYATDQIDVTDNLKVRLGVRKNWWDTALTPLITVPTCAPGSTCGAPNPSPGVFNSEGQPLIAGVTQTRNDAPVSWNIGALYHLFLGVSPYFGISKSFLTNFNSENVQNGIGAPESALQYEAGIKFSLLNDRLVLNTAAFDVSRDNVAAAVTINSVETVVFDSQRTTGFEASLDTKVTEQWHILANVTDQNAIITDNPQGITSVGNHPQGVPAHMANLWSIYNFSIAGIPGFQFGAGLNYRDKTFSDITNVNSVPAYIIGNIALAYETPKWGVSLNVKNITNERYFVAPNVAGAFVGDPLSAFVTMRVKDL